MEPDTSRPLIRAAEYVRMSSDRQEYSTTNQHDTNLAYAALHRMAIVRTYADEGRSGLSLDRRDGLKRLIEDVQSGRADFVAVLVYDVSRWGRFQDVDESGFYEYLCRRAGIAVHYCAEQFANDGSPIAAIVKALKRAMAAEYSRELSVKVFNGQSRLARLGYRLGGNAGYGLRRMLVGPDGAPKRTLGAGEWKEISTDRIVLVPGPPDEVETVRQIFSLFVHGGKNERRIAAILNELGAPNGFGRPWHHSTVRRILCSEKYAGDCIWNKSSFKLQQTRVRNDPDRWMRVADAFPAVVERRLFDAAQEIFETRRRYTTDGRPRGLSDEQMIEALRQLRLKHGYLTRGLIEKSRELPSADAYYRRFGGLKGPYKKVGVTLMRGKGVTPSGRPRGLSNEEMLDVLQRLWAEHGHLSEEIIRTSKSAPHPSLYFVRFGSLTRAYALIGFKPYPERMRPIPRRVSDETWLDELRAIWRVNGRLSRAIIDASGIGPSHGTIDNRFGGLRQAYERIGYAADRPQGRGVRPRGLSDEQMLQALRDLLRERGHLSQKLLRATRSAPSTYSYMTRFGSLTEAFRRVGYVVRRHRPRR